MKEMSDSLIYEKRRNNKMTQNNWRKQGPKENSQNFEIVGIERREAKDWESEMSNAILSQRSRRDAQVTIYQ